MPWDILPPIVYAPVAIMGVVCATLTLIEAAVRRVGRIRRAIRNERIAARDEGGGGPDHPNQTPTPEPPTLGEAVKGLLPTESTAQTPERAEIPGGDPGNGEAPA